MERHRLALSLALTSILLAYPARAALNANEGAFIFRTYSAKDYSASGQNWSIVQGRRGILYFGNINGILSYDGVNWKLIPMPSGTVAASLGLSANGTVYVGGIGEFGYLEAGPDGLTRFVSLLGRLSVADRNFGRVWDVIPRPEGVYFGSFDRIFRLNRDGSIQVFSPKVDKFYRIFLADDHVYVKTAQGDFYRVDRDALAPGLSGRHFADEGVVGTCQLGNLTVIASGRRLYRLAGNSIEPFPTEMDDYLQKHQIYTVFALRTGDIAVGTVSGGLVLLGPAGRLDRVVDKAAGAPSNGITSLYQDHQGGIWLTTDDSGIARFDPALTRFGVAQGIQGLLSTIHQYNGYVFAGGTKGFYRLDDEAKPASFKLFGGLNELTAVMMDYDANAFVGAQHGLYLINRDNLQKILAGDIRGPVWDLAKSGRDYRTMYTAGRDGICVLQRTGETWKVVKKVTEHEEFRTVAEDPDGWVWGTTMADIWRFNFSSQQPKAERFTSANGVPTGFKSVYRFNGHIVFATEKGLMTFAAADRRLVPDTELGPRFADGSHGVSLITHDAQRNIWITGQGYNGILRKQGNNEYAWEPMPMLESGIQEVYAWTIDRDGVAWASGGSGDVYRWDTHLAGDPNRDFDVEFENIKSPSAEFGGAGSLAKAPTLPYQENELTFAYAAPSYDEEPAAANQEDENGPEPQRIEYQFRLAGAGGKENQWSKWSAQTQKDLNNLWEHSYAFEVRARNPHGVITAPAIFRFTVLPPWYRTWWAYLPYLAATVLTGWRLFRWRVRILEENNRRLEQTVEERTIEVRQQRDQNEALLLNILPKPVATELRSTGTVTPMTFDDVTVCFTDFVGFTLSSEKLPAETLVTTLNEYFTAFDEIMGRYGLEKLKTIGDSYMFVSGLPERRPSHAVDAVLAALEMVDVVRKLSQPGAPVNWKVRVGLFSGPVVAGVVGVRKFAFDIWGNTVNFAARMESSGAANRVNLAAVTWERVRGLIDCEARGPVKIKEGRFMEMYFALGPQADLLHGNVIDGIPEAFRQRYQAEFGIAPRSFPSMVEIPTA